MAETLKTKILSVNVVRCHGSNPKNLGSVVGADALLTCRVDGTVEVACPFYNSYPIGDTQRDNSGTCYASNNGKGNCVYRKVKPDTKLD